MQTAVLYRYDLLFASRVTDANQVFFFIRIKSKEIISAILVRKKKII